MTSHRITALVQQDPWVRLLSALLFPILVGCGFAAAKTVLDVLPPTLLAAMRYAIGGLAMLLIFGPPPLKVGLLLIPISALAVVLQFVLTYSGMALLPLSSATFLIQLETPFVVLLGALVLREVISTRRLLGIGISLLGAAVMLLTASSDFSLFGSAILILGAFLWATGPVAIMKLGLPNGFRMAAWLAIVAAPQLLILSFIMDGNPMPYMAALNNVDWMAIAFIGLGPTVFAYGLWFWLTSVTSINQIAPVLPLVPVVSILCGVFFLGETLELNTVIGGAIIVFGTLLASDIVIRNSKVR